MKKQILVLNQAEGYTFGLNGRDITVSESMAIGDAEHLQGLYPGLYVKVIEVAEVPTDQPAAAAAPKANAKTVKPAETTETAK